MNLTERDRERLALAEYTAIKSEQVARIGFRDNLLYVTLVAIGGVLTVTHAGHDRGYLLLIPVVTFVLGWTYYANDHMITAIGRYFRGHPALSGAVGWETGHPADRRRAARKRVQLAVDLTAFCVPAAAALAAFWAVPEPAVLLAASAAEAITTGLLAWQFTTAT